LIVASTSSIPLELATLTLGNIIHVCCCTKDIKTSKMCHWPRWVLCFLHMCLNTTHWPFINTIMSYFYNPKGHAYSLLPITGFCTTNYNLNQWCKNLIIYNYWTLKHNQQMHFDIFTTWKHKSSFYILFDKRRKHVFQKQLMYFFK
jgi:hypothetical protein